MSAFGADTTVWPGICACLLPWLFVPDGGLKTLAAETYFFTLPSNSVCWSNVFPRPRLRAFSYVYTVVTGKTTLSKLPIMLVGKFAAQRTIAEVAN